MTRSAETVTSLETRARAIRRTVIRMCMARGQGYAGQGLALADVLASLYFSEVDSSRDTVVLSTGHSAVAIFAALHEQGIYELEELETYGMDGSRIEESPLEGTPGFPITGGSLGQGLSQAVGFSLGARLRGAGGRVYCIVSDGELQEGQVWEAAMLAGKRGLDNLVLLIDNNRMQADGATIDVLDVEPVAKKLEAFGFVSRTIDPHRIAEILDAFAWARGAQGQPVAVVCETVPGKGVPSFERYTKAHYIRAERAVWENALRELDA